MVDEGPLSLGKFPFISAKPDFDEQLYEYFIRLKKQDEHLFKFNIFNISHREKICMCQYKGFF